MLFLLQVLRGLPRLRRLEVRPAQPGFGSGTSGGGGSSSSSPMAAAAQKEAVCIQPAMPAGLLELDQLALSLAALQLEVN